MFFKSQDVCNSRVEMTKNRIIDLEGRKIVLFQCKLQKQSRLKKPFPQTPGCPGRSPRREKARSTWGEGARTAGCRARARRVLRTHSDICLQRPALPQQD